MNNVVEGNLTSSKKTVKSNVAIASAITSYARIKMLPFKMNDKVIYTDTDSVITTEKLDPSVIGPGLGLMKDELNGKVIEEILVLGCKQYGSPSSTPCRASNPAPAPAGTVGMHAGGRTVLLWIN